MTGGGPTGLGSSFGVRSTFSKPSRMSSDGLSARTESFPRRRGHVGRAVADVDPVVALVTGDDVEAAARRDRVVARSAEERLRRASARERVVARPAGRCDREGADVADGDAVVAAEAVGVQRLAGADVDRERHEVRPVEPDARAVGLDRERVARRRSAVDLDVVAAVVAVRDVGAVAVVPDQRVVARAAVHRVGAAVAHDAVVAAAAVEDVVALAAEDQIRPSEPLTVSAPAPPSTDSSVNAPTPSFAVIESFPPRPLTSKRSVAASNVNGPIRPPQPDGAADDGIEGEDVAERRRAVDLGHVVAGVAVRLVRAVALVPHQRVVAGLRRP